MTLRHMKIFVSVYQNSSITNAAKELHLAQPSVSLAVRELEEHYGRRFFERIGRKIYPTADAKELYGYAAHLVSLYETMEKELKNNDEIGTIRVGASITIGTHILPELIQRVQTRFPELKIEAVVNQSGTIERLLMQNEIDLGMIENQPSSDAVLAVPFMEDTLAAIVPKENPLAGKKNVTLKDMAGYPFLMREKGSAGREILDACLDMEQITVRPAWESSSTQAIVQGVAKGLGVAVLPYLLVKRDLEEERVRQAFLRRPIRRNLNIIYHKSKYITKSMQTLMSMCIDGGQELHREEERNGKPND